jgi:uncharacterized protein YrrD
MIKIRALIYFLKVPVYAARGVQEATIGPVHDCLKLGQTESTCLFCLENEAGWFHRSVIMP